MDESSEFIENILLEILDRPNLWLEKGDSQKFNIQTFNAQKAALAFLQQYKNLPFVKGEKIILFYNNEKLHLIVRTLKYGNIEMNSTVEFIYRQIIFCEIKWPRVIINNIKQNETPLNKTKQPIAQSLSNEFDDHPLSSSAIMTNSQYKSIDNININEKPRFRSTVFLRLN